MNNIVISNHGEPCEINVNPEAPYFSITGIKEINGNDINVTDYILSYKLEGKTGGRAEGTVGLYKLLENGEYTLIPSNSEYEVITLSLQPNENKEVRKVRLEYSYIERFDISSPLDKFERHLTNPRNTKILFSSPFGQGKTTFLSLFFNDSEKKNEYEIFNIIPINYSVANNADIFKYIKTDILYQILGNSNINYEKLDPSHLETLPDYLKDNLHKVLAPFLMAIPEIGKSVYSIYKEIDKVKDEYLKFHKEQEIDELISINSYMQMLISEEGSIFEDNFITQLIREKINQIKESGKKTVLIIDDLDRMDPDHTFRILNVISTHYDTVRENQDFEPNKFGFDKIILVGDYDNIQKIFEHRYGEKVNFSGYMTKFFSVEPFHYNNAEMMTSLIFKIINKEINNGLIRNSISLVFKSLIYGGQISLRDILKFQNFDYTTIINGYRNQVQGNNLSNGLFTPIIIYLYKIGSKDVIISKLSKCKDTEIEMHRMKYNYCWHLISELVNHNENVNGLYKYKYKDHDLTFTLQRTFDFDFNEPQNINIKNSIGEDVNIGDFQFDQHDFIGLLIENIEKINYQPF